MKRVPILAVAIIFFAGSAPAVLPQVGYIGIFKDAQHITSPPLEVTNYVCPAQYSQFTAYIWCLPSSGLFRGAEFAVSFPAVVT